MLLPNFEFGAWAGGAGASKFKFGERSPEKCPSRPNAPQPFLILTVCLKFLLQMLAIGRYEKNILTP